MNKNKKLVILSLLIFTICILMPIVSASNDTIYVSCDGDDTGDGSITNPYYNITRALDDVMGNKNIIVLKNGSYSQGEINITKSVTIIGEGNSILDGKGEFKIFNINNTKANVNIMNLTFINAYSNSFGAAIINNATLYVDNVVFENNSARSGAAIDNSYNLTVANSLFISNDAFGRDGGAVSNVANATIIGSTFVNNTAARNGGAIKGQGNKFRIINSTFVRNSALGNDNYGGAIYVWASKIEILNSTFNGNAAGYGGAIFIGGGNIDSTGLTINQSVFDSNNAILGEGIEIEEGVVNISYSKLVDDVCVLKTKNADLNYNWWGLNNPSWDNIVTSPKPTVYAVLKIINDKDNLKTALYWVNTTRVVTEIPDLYGSINSEDVEFNREYVFNLSNLTAVLDNEVQNFNADSKIKTKLTADDIEMYYHDKTRFIVYLNDIDGNPLPNQSVIITINNVSYNKTTDGNGQASMAINLDSGRYVVDVVYNSKENHYLSSNATSIVNVLPTVNGTDVIKVFRNATQYIATFRDSEGNYLKEGTPVRFNINGVMYDRKVSGDNGIAKLNINLAQGDYVLTAINHATGENAANNITVISRIVENNDLTKYYRNDSQYMIKVLGDDGNAAGAGVEVRFNINGVFYTRTTNESGIAKLNINLQPDDYIITAEYGECKVSNKIKVLPILSASDISMSYRDGTQFKVNVFNGTGCPLTGADITFNVNGVFYTRTSDVNGQANLNINLQAGEYIITSTYNNLNIANRITIN